MNNKDKIFLKIAKVTYSKNPLYRLAYFPDSCKEGYGIRYSFGGESLARFTLRCFDEMDIILARRELRCS